MELLVALLPVLLGIVGTFVSNRLNNSSLTGAQQEQNTFNAMQAQQQREWSSEQTQATMQFNAEEAEKNRAFQAQQAENQMAFQRDMDSTLYQRRVADMQSAGLNPALAVGGVSVGATAGASANGSQASASPLSGAAAAGSAGLFPQSMSDLMQGGLFSAALEQMRADIANKNQDTIKKAEESGLISAQTEEQIKKNTWFDKMQGAEFDEIMQRIDSGKADAALKRAGVSAEEAKAALTWVQEKIANVDAKYREQIVNLDMQRQTAEIEYVTTQSAAAKRNLDLIDGQIVKVYEEAATEQVLRSKYSAEAGRAASESDLIRQETQTEAFRTSSARSQASLDDFNAANKEVRFKFEKAEKIVDMTSTGVRAAGSAAGSVIGGSALKGVTKTPWFKRFARYYSRGGGGR